MAQTTMTLTCEMEEMHDAIASLKDIHGRLAKMHGDDFRKLDRMIENLLDGCSSGFVEIHWLGGGKMMAAPKGDFTAIFAEARRLGIID